jgi:secondary thiamine-phosphate synthase enzyme
VLKTTPSETTGLKIRTHTLMFRTERGPQFIDITDRVVQLVQESGIENGFAVVFSKHTTAAIIINENEPGLIADLEATLTRMLPHDDEYDHNTYHPTENGERPNGHSHCQHVFLGTSEHIPVVGGALTFGQWQRVFLVELDHAREREVVIQILGW